MRGQHDNQTQKETRVVQIFENQKVSGLSVPAFCEANNIKTHSFHARMSDLKSQGDVSRAKADKPSKLIKVDTPSPASTSVTLSYQSVSLSIPMSASPAYIVNMVKALAS